MLVAVRPIGSVPKRGVLWELRCDCGNTHFKTSGDFMYGQTKSCGCSTSLFIIERQTTHNMSRHSVYGVWKAMRERCLSPKCRAWGNYGGRGITVCDRWKESFEAFWEDMKEGYAPGLELDRRDNDGGYNKENCRWVTRQENNSNRSDNVWVATPKGAMTVARASREYGIHRRTLYNRISRGWPEYRLLEKPK